MNNNAARIACVCLVWVCALFASAARADDIRYVYDESGRLVQASNLTTGEAVRYTYDAVGNITSQISGSLSTLAIGHFSPRRAPVGVPITINGTGFGATPGANVVRFNGVAAAVVSASQTQLVATVPAAATTGTISVEVAGVTATSSEVFTVTTVGDGPVITAVFPNIGLVDNVVTIIGANFSADPRRNRVQFGGVTAQVSASTTTSISTRVPPRAESGKIRVITPQGVATSPMDYIVVPSGNGPESVDSVGRIPNDGSPQVISLAEPNKFALRLFEGKAGDLLTIGTSDSDFPSCIVHVFTPDGVLFVSSNLSAALPGLRVPKLPVTGTYMVMIVPWAVGDITLRILHPLAPTLTFNAAPTTAVIEPPGRRVMFTFSSAANVYADIELSDITIPSGSYTLFTPAGVELRSAPLDPAGIRIQPWLQHAGTYKLLIDPSDTFTGAITASLRTTLSGLGREEAIEFDIGDDPMRLTFQAKRGEFLALFTRVGDSTGVFLEVRDPIGALVGSRGVGGWDGVLNLGPLRESGTYTVIVQRFSPSGDASGVEMRLSAPVHGGEFVNGSSFAPLAINGQGSLHLFGGLAGQFYTLTLREIDLMAGAALSVYKPDGTLLASDALPIKLGDGGLIGGDNDAFRDGSAMLNFGPLPMTGTYQVVLQQIDIMREQDRYYGLFELLLKQPLRTSSEEPGLETGQGVLYELQGSAGEFISVGMTSDMGGQESVGGIAATVFDVENTPMAVTNFSIFDVGTLSRFGSGVLNVGPLPASGTYKLFIQQLGTSYVNEGPVKTRVSRPLVNDPDAPFMQITRSGQGVKQTFTGAIGDYRSISVGTSSGITAGTVKVFLPDGKLLGSTSLVPRGANGNFGHGLLSIGPLTVPGTYTALFEQTGSGTVNVGNVTLRVSGPRAGTLPSNGAPTPIALPIPGQGLRYTFTADAGSYRSLVVGETEGTIETATVSVLQPDGAVLNSGFLTTIPSTAPDGSTVYSGRTVLNVGPMPATGTYAVVVQQIAYEPSDTPPSLTVTLSQPLQGTLVPASTQIVSIDTQGQGVLRTFAGVAGQHYTVRVTETDDGISDAIIKFIRPDGSLLRAAPMTIPAACGGCPFSGSGILGSGALPSSGTYAVLVQQTALNGSGEGDLSFELANAAAGAGGTSTISTSTPGEAATVDFAAIAGQSVTVALTQVTSSPNSLNSYTVMVRRPDGAILAWIGCSTQWSGCEVPLRQLPESGTYRVEVTPAVTDTIAATVTITPAAVGVLTAGTPSTVNLSQLGQAAELAFSVPGGQLVTLNVGSISLMPADTHVTVQVFNAAGEPVAYDNSPIGLTINLPALAAGNYWVWITPDYPASGALQVTLHTSAATAVPANGSSNVFNLPAPNQLAYFNFNATAGQHIGVALSDLAMSPSGWVSLTVLSPSGATIDGRACGVAGCEIAVRNLPESGVYRIHMLSGGTTSASGTLTISQALSGVLTPNQATTVNLATVGRMGHFTFTAATDDIYALRLESLGTTPADINYFMRVYNSGGTAFRELQVASADTLNLPRLAAGTYSVLLFPEYPATANLQVTLLSRVGSAIDDGVASQFAAARGQTAHFTFDAESAQSISIALKDVVATPNAATSYGILLSRPDGANIGQWNCGTGADCLVTLRNLPSSGTYRVEIRPQVNDALSGTLVVSKSLTGMLLADAPKSLDLTAPGQMAELNFTATAGESYSLDLATLSAMPADVTMYVEVVNSRGQAIAYGNYTAGFSLALAHLLSTDTYTVFLLPSSPITGSHTVTLRRPTVVSPGVAANFATSIPGQAALFAFAGVAGQDLGFGVTDAVVEPSPGWFYQLSLFYPNSTTRSDAWNCNSVESGCATARRDLPLNGQYLLEIRPQPNETIQGAVILSNALTGTLSAGVASNVTLAIPGQPAQLDLNLASPQSIAVQVSVGAATPANTTFDIHVYDATGVVVTYGSVDMLSPATVHATDLPAGNYQVWIMPRTSATASLSVSY